MSKHILSKDFKEDKIILWVYDDVTKTTTIEETTIDNKVLNFKTKAE